MSKQNKRSRIKTKKQKHNVKLCENKMGRYIVQ